MLARTVPVLTSVLMLATTVLVQTRLLTLATTVPILTSALTLATKDEHSAAGPTTNPNQITGF